jgi:hypothetical protein
MTAARIAERMPAAAMLMIMMVAMDIGNTPSFGGQRFVLARLPSEPGIGLGFAAEVGESAVIRRKSSAKPW